MSASSASGQGSDSLVDVNPATGQGCSIGPVASSGIYGLDYVAGMGVVNEQLLGLTNTGQLLSINPTTGAGVVVATTTPTVLAAGAAVLPTPASTGIPAPPFPVILVHGLGSDARTWIPFSSLLCSDGWTFGGTPMIDRATNTVTGTTPGDEYAMNFTDNQTLTFSRQGWELAAMIGAVLAVNPGKDRVVLVGHSMGGLAARSTSRASRGSVTGRCRFPSEAMCRE